ncbi:MAG: PspC domain [Candidatus Parcubacteria bacterium]|jgi:phage shock protein PspC (stress-responsive transcriptional regulator)
MTRPNDPDQDTRNQNDEPATAGQAIRRELIAFKLMPEPKCWLGGVCSAIAYRLALPAWVVRLAFTLLLLCYGVGFWPYMILWIFVPLAQNIPSDYDERTGNTGESE